MMDSLLYCDALAIFYLQDWLYCLPYMETVAMAVTRLGDPHISYVITFPIVYWFLGATAGYHVLLIACISEWFNIVLKWLLMGNRPYWWVWLHTDWPHLLHQSSVTCETGPGNPSGHVMITLAVLLTCADYVSTSNCHHFVQTNFRHAVWLVVLAIAISRLLISTHFIYQTMCGVAAGVLLHVITGSSIISLITDRWKWMLALAPFMIALALFLYHIWTWLGMNPGFSISLAQRYCANSEWVQPNTTPHFSLMRSAGAVVGVAIMIALRPFPQRPHSVFISSLGIMMSLILIGCLGMIPMATETTVFYIQALCMCAAVPVLVGGMGVVIGNYPELDAM